MNPDWTAEGYITSAATFSEYYARLAEPHIIGWVDLANQWGLALIGAALILGLFVRWVGLAGFVLMLLYYFPVLEFPHVENSIIVDQHIIYALLLILLQQTEAGMTWGLGTWWRENVGIAILA